MGVWSLLVNLPVDTVPLAIEVAHHKQGSDTNSPLMCSMGTPVGSSASSQHHAAHVPFLVSA